MEENNIQEAKEVFAGICRMLDNNKWQYTKNEEDMYINTKAVGKDLSMEISMLVEPENCDVLLQSYLPFTVPDDLMRDMAVAICETNQHILNGRFVLKAEEKNVVFYMSNHYGGALLNDDVYEYLLMVSCRTIDDYNDKLMLLAKKKVNLERYMKAAFPKDEE